MKTHSLPLLAASLFALSLAAQPGCVKVPSSKNERESGQSKLMDDTVAGRGKCDPENHERPFIIEWDATDMSSFESYAANDMVMVHYEGCKLTIVDSCRDDSVRGSHGSYKAVEWTSGSLEAIDIADENELYAKLPLGEATLGGRVRSGEKFKMEYYVAGTRTATRSKVYTADLEKKDGCEDVTHFVYAYNLGAFALGSVQSLEANAGVSLYGFGGGGNKTTTRKADKKGGDLAKCQSDSAKEIDGCKVPVRLTLRKVTEGENPKQEEMRAEDTDASLNAAAKLELKLDEQGKAGDLYRAAQERANAKDGKACLAELDKRDKLAPKAQSTDPKAPQAFLRGQCLMLAGKCDAGKQLLRKVSENNNPTGSGPEQIDATVTSYASLWCQGKMSPRDTLSKAFMDLTMGMSSKKPAKECQDAFATIRKVGPTVKLDPDDDADKSLIDQQKNAHYYAAACLSKAGDCDAAFKAYADGYPMDSLKAIEDPALRQKIVRDNFESSFQKCKGK
ncbi:MAG TPA: hypothetical protein PKW35_03210 [Nannocystaceae bacterium]|nr:hypothetical protein [Nannocystaceae bacterium]